MKKLIIQIPCLNEEKTLPQTIRDIPRQIEGIDKVEVLVVDDGSTDRTIEVAKENGADHITRLPSKKGLARAFIAGLDASLALGADIIVNTDADNQYCGGDIPKLVRPILEGKADMVIGVRDIKNIKHFSMTKKWLQRIGTWVVKNFSGTNIKDATSGFRAYSRDVAMKLNVVSDFTYTIETIIQAGHRQFTIDQVDVQTNEKLRESRLISSLKNYVMKGADTIIRIYAMHKPLKVFTIIGSTLFLAGVLLGLRFIYFWIITPPGQTVGHVQLVVLSAVFLIVGFQVVIIGLMADLISANRKLIEDMLNRVKKIDYDYLFRNKKIYPKE
jgi:glycosyltransferase involved in cell wall biosynthesis